MPPLPHQNKVRDIHSSYHQPATAPSTGAYTMKKHMYRLDSDTWGEIVPVQGCDCTNEGTDTYLLH